jgi:lipopolysaccharide/colanic/teichoic acid biosynthesis glycosyltransferase
LNVLAAGLLLILALPVMAIIAVAVKVTSPGPVIYRQPRVGYDRRRHATAVPLAGQPARERRSADAGGRIFSMFKFRTMHDRGSASVDQVRACPGDPRVTTVGAFLRRHRLDELPQLFNVLIGDMNVVGPRPEQPRLFRELERSVSGYADRQAVLPGITGRAQISLRYDRSVDDVRRKLELDLQYIERRSVIEDLRIMAGTLPVMLVGRGSL